MFSQTIEYALRAMVCLAAEPERPLANREIAAITKVPSAYLSKVLQTLGRHELVVAERGVRGGFRLARPADAITILEVVNAVDPIRRIATCPLGLKAHGKRLCPLHGKLDQALAQAEAAFASTTLAGVLAEPTTSVPLCEFPPRRHQPKSSRKVKAR